MLCSTTSKSSYLFVLLFLKINCNLAVAISLRYRQIYIANEFIAQPEFNQNKILLLFFLNE